MLTEAQPRPRQYEPITPLQPRSSALSTRRSNSMEIRKPEPILSAFIPETRILKPWENRQTVPNFRQACGHCAQEGHFSRDCCNARVIFCWHCGHLGNCTMNCCRQANPGNGGGLRPSGERTETTRGTPEPNGIFKVRDDCLTAKVRIEVQIFDASFDTGASRSFASERVD